MKDIKDVAKTAAGVYIGSKLAQPKPETTYEESTIAVADEARGIFQEWFGPQGTHVTSVVGACVVFGLAWALLAALGAGLGACVLLAAIMGAISYFFIPYIIIGVTGIAIIVGFFYLVYLLW